MNRNRKELVLTAAIISVGLGLSLTPSAFAQFNPPQNDFGKGASGLGGALGTHSREGGAAGTAPYDGSDALDPAKGRTGIGNTGNVVCPDSTVKLHPDDLARVLGGAACPP